MTYFNGLGSTSFEAAAELFSLARRKASDLSILRVKIIAQCAAVESPILGDFASCTAAADELKTLIAKLKAEADPVKAGNLIKASDRILTKFGEVSQIVSTDALVELAVGIGKDAADLAKKAAEKADALTSPASLGFIAVGLVALVILLKK